MIAHARRVQLAPYFALLFFSLALLPSGLAAQESSPQKIGIATEPRAFLNGSDVVVDPKLDVNGDIAVAQDLNTKPAFFYSHYDSKATPPIYYPRYKTYIDANGKGWGLAQYRGGGSWADTLKAQDGLVGIGTSKPTKNLTVVSGGQNTAIQIKNNSKNAKRWNLMSSGAGSKYPEGSFILEDDAAGTPALAVAPNGNIGLGTSNPQGQLEIFGPGDIIFRNDSDRTGGLAFQNQKGDEFGKIYGSGEGLRLRANSVRNEDMFINRYNGNVGIGTVSTPSSRLYVVAQTEGINANAYRAVIATSNNGYGVTAIGGNAGIGISTTGRIGIQSLGTTYDFYAQGSGSNYGPFTGSHEVKMAPDAVIEKGMIVSVTGQTETRSDGGGISLSSTLPTVALASQENDPKILGVMVSEGALPEGHWYEAKQDERFAVINALGEGRVWVCDINGPVSAGDFITSSNIPGYGQKQNDDLVHSYTLGKAIESVDWSKVSETMMFEGKTIKKALVGVVYTSG